MNYPGKSKGKQSKQLSRQTCRNTPLTYAKTQIAGTYIHFLQVKFCRLIVEGICKFNYANCICY